MQSIHHADARLTKDVPTPSPPTSRLPQRLLDAALRDKGQALDSRALREENEALRHDVLKWRAAAQASLRTRVRARARARAHARTHARTGSTRRGQQEQGQWWRQCSGGGGGDGGGCRHIF